MSISKKLKFYSIITNVFGDTSAQTFQLSSSIYVQVDKIETVEAINFITTGRKRE